MKKLAAIFLLSLLFNLSYVVKAQDSPKNYLKGKFYTTVKNHFLVATEKMNDNRFSQTVIVMLESDQNGALEEPWGTISGPIGPKGPHAGVLGGPGGHFGTFWEQFSINLSSFFEKGRMHDSI